MCISTILHRRPGRLSADRPYPGRAGTGPHQNPEIITRLALAALAAFVLLGALYSIVNPVFESPDEVYHYPYVKYVADGNGLPVQSADVKMFYEQEGSQPPLYYLMTAWLTRSIDTDDLPAIRRLNPHARIGVALAKDNKNMVVHTDAERFPWRGTVLAVHLIRFFGLLLGAGTAWCTFLLARALFPDRPVVALLALVLNVFAPMFPFISGSVNNDNLVILLSSIVLMLLVRSIQRGPRYARTVTIGVLVGLGMLAKLSGIALLPISLLGLLLARAEAEGLLQVESWRSARQPAGRQDLRPRLVRVARHVLGDWALIVALALLISSWWYLRNLRLYGDPLGLNTMLDIFGRRDSRPTLGELLAEFQGFRISYWGLFGVVNVLMQPHFIYRLLDAYMLFAVVGCVRWVIRGARSGGLGNGPSLFVLFVWTSGVGVSLVRWTMMTKASQGRLVFPAISAISLFMALGTLSWFRRPQWPRVTATVCAALLVLAIAAPFSAIGPAYARPQVIMIDDIPADATLYGVTFEDAARLVAFTVAPEQVSPGDEVEVTLYWEALAPIDEDLSIFIHLFGRDGQRLGQRDSYTGGGNYPTSMWSPGEVIGSRYLVPVREDADGPVAVDVVVGMYRLETMHKLAAEAPDGTPVTWCLLDRLRLDVPGPTVQPDQVLEVGFGSSLRLLGYELSAGTLRAGESLDVTLYWQATGRPERDYQVFVHLVDGGGRLIGQGDGPPLRGQFPTSLWRAGDELTDVHSLDVSSDTQSGQADLYIGFYDLATGARVPVLDAAGEVQGDAVMLTSVRIE